MTEENVPSINLNIRRTERTMKKVHCSRRSTANLPAPHRTQANKNALTKKVTDCFLFSSSVGCIQQCARMQLYFYSPSFALYRQKHRYFAISSCGMHKLSKIELLINTLFWPVLEKQRVCSILPSYHHPSTFLAFLARFFLPGKVELAYFASRPPGYSHQIPEQTLGGSHNGSQMLPLCFKPTVCLQKWAVIYC